jgi:hypothetical protein
MWPKVTPNVTESGQKRGNSGNTVATKQYSSFPNCGKPIAATLANISFDMRVSSDAVGTIVLVGLSCCQPEPADTAVCVSKAAPKPDFELLAAAAWPRSTAAHSFSRWSADLRLVDSESLFIYVLLILFAGRRGIRRAMNRITACSIFDAAGAITDTQSMRLMETSSSLKFVEIKALDESRLQEMLRTTNEMTKIERDSWDLLPRLEANVCGDVQSQAAPPVWSRTGRWQRTMMPPSRYCSSKADLPEHELPRRFDIARYSGRSNACMLLAKMCRHSDEFMRRQPNLADGFLAVARWMVKLRRMAEINTALLAALAPASGPSVRKWRDWRGVPERRTAWEHSTSM